VIYYCCGDARKAAVLGNPALNGIDYLEVLGFDADPLGLTPQTILMVRCLNAAPATVTPDNVVIVGGESVTNARAVWVTLATAPPASMTAAQKTFFTSLPNAANVLLIGTSSAGDFSPYTLRLVTSVQQAKEDPFAVTEVLAGFDPQLAEVKFWFKVECPPFFDCKPEPPDCPPDLPAPPAINYLAKDYGSFRTVILDRLSQLLPEWTASSEADFGIALAELLAYVGDSLSYKQDAVATEAYLETARSRVSLRRHTRLVDYRVSDGCNARTWMQLHVDWNVSLLAGTVFNTYAPAMPPTVVGHERRALDAGVIVFQAMQNAELFPAHNEISFYTWGESSCCLPKGATEATLAGTLADLKIGDVLIFQEMVGPQTGNAADADVRHRCAVRLTQVATHDAAGNVLVDPLFEDKTGKPITSAAQNPTPVTEIQWSSDDALPFPVCISSTYVDPHGQEQRLSDVSKAFGNVVLADHGVTLSGIDLGMVPRSALSCPPKSPSDHCTPIRRVPMPARFRPLIPDSPITQAVALASAGSPTTAAVSRLKTSSAITLSDADGLVSLLVQPKARLSWPTFFGVVASQNATNVANFDLAIVYNPPGGPPGLSTPPVLERVANLSLTTTDPNYVVGQVNARSRFINISGAPPGPVPAGFPTAPAMLSVGSPTDLEDAGAVTYLTVTPKPAATWPPSFGLLAQDSISIAGQFNLLVVYAPMSGGTGVPTPVVVERFTSLSPSNVDAKTGSSNLVTVESFEGEPNLALSACDLMHYDAAEATPVMTLTSLLDGDIEQWTPDYDLLADGPTDTHFVLEIETDGTAWPRTGDNVNGRRPSPDTEFSATYRVGNGTAGNVGANTLNYCSDLNVIKCTNPLPAIGGTDPETPAQIRRRAPQAFVKQERAVTMPDYERVAEMNSCVENAVATLRWTGSWYTVFTTAEPKCGGTLSSNLRRDLRKRLNRYRLAGQDIDLRPPQYVSLEIDLTVCVDPDYFRSDVEAALDDVLGSRVLPDGTKGLFHSDNFTFGQTVYLSPIYAAARKVAGVTSVEASVFQPQSAPSTSVYLGKGEIPLGPFQIARLENDRSFPDHGQLTLTMQGGK